MAHGLVHLLLEWAGVRCMDGTCRHLVIKARAVVVVAGAPFSCA